MTRMTGGRAVVEMLRRHGVNTLFALPGVQNDALFSALYDAGGAVRVVHTRHEQGAAYMAYGYAKSTGGVGAYAVVPGPGVLNTTAALATAYAANARVLCLSGQIATNMIGRGWGMLHEIPDQFAILRGLTKWAARAEHPTQIPALLDEAFYQLNSGRPRPVALEIPMDVLALETDVTLTEGRVDAVTPAPDAQAIEQAAALLAKAAHPLIMVGSGADDAGAALLAVAELLQAPVVSVSNGRGVVSDQHYLGLHGPGGHRLWLAADVVLAVGGAYGTLSEIALALVVIFWANPSSFTPQYKSDMRDVSGEMAPYLHQGDLVIVGQPEQAPLAWYYLPSGLRFADVTGLSTDPQSMNWVRALARLRAANPQATVAPLVASLKPGQQILFVRPLTEGAKSWEAPWTQLVRRRSAQWGAILSTDRSLRQVWLAPHNYRGACCVGDSAVLYKKVA